MTACARKPRNHEQPVDLPIGRVMWRGFAVLARSFVPFIVISAAATATPFFYTWYHPGALRSVETVASVTLYIVFRGACDAMIVYATVQAVSGRPVRPGTSVVRGLRRMGPVLLTATLAGVAFAVGCFLLLVPGLIATVVMFVAIPACVMERLDPIQSVQRSSALTRGWRWQIFAAYSAIVAVSVVVNWLIGTLTPGTSSWLFAAVGFGWMALVNAYEAVLMAVIYYDLRVVKDQMDADRIAEAFD